MNQSDLLKNWKNRSKPASPVNSVIESRPEGAVVLATEGQRRLWLLQQLYPNSAFYQYTHQYDFTGPLDLDLLEQSFQQLVERREILRTNFIESESGLELCVRPSMTVKLESIQLTKKPLKSTANSVASKTNTVIREKAPETNYNLATLARKSVENSDDNFSLLPDHEVRHEARTASELKFGKQLFDLAQDPLFRIGVIKLGEDQHRILFSLHHIIGDRGSLQVLETELFTIYSALVNGQSPKLPELPIQFPDFAYWKARQKRPEEQLTNWVNYLSGPIPQPDLSPDFNRPEQPSFRGESVKLKLDKELSAGIDRLTKQLQTTPNVIFLAVFQLLQHRYSGAEDVWVGSPVSIRNRTEMQQLVGFLNETLIFRSSFQPGDTFNKLVDRLKPATERALNENGVTFEDLVEKLNPERFGGWNPLFQTMFVYNAESVTAKLPAGLSVEDKMVDLGTSKFDLTLFATRNSGSYDLSLEFAKDLFKAATARATLRHLESLLKGIINNPNREITTLSLLSPGEQQQILADWNETNLTAKPDFLPLSILDAARINNHKTAVSDGNSHLTYGDLISKSTTIAKNILEAKQTDQSIIGLYGNRHPDTVAGMLGVQLAGFAYLPLDPDYPAERIKLMLEDSGVKIVVDQTGEATQQLGTDYQFISVPAQAEPTENITLPEFARDQLAYVIYTSGSTGRPKGVPITHGNLAHSTAARYQFFDRSPACFLLMSSFSFDSSVAGIFWTLATGGTLLLSPKRAEQDPAGLAKLIQEQGVTHTLLLPSLYQLLLEYGKQPDLTGLQTVMVAGEASSTSLVKRHFATLPNTQLVNEYGPTEGTVWSTAYMITPQDTASTIPIGRPIPGVKHYIVDQYGQPLPAGYPGELMISGPGLSPGYFLRPELTKQRFAVNPFSNEPGYERWYRTGDLVKYRRESAGTIDFLGRRDQQLKIRGYRIELGEIAQAIENIPTVQEAIVKPFKTSINDQVKLVAYFTLLPGSEQKLELRNELVRQLPDYMVPAVLTQLDDFPRLPNGKVDVKSLPESTQGANSAQIDPQFTPPETELEIQLAKIWERVLGYTPVGRNVNFFSAGGDSLKSIRVIGEARKINLKLQPHHLFVHQTIGELAAALAEEQAIKRTLNPDEADYRAVVPLKPSGNKHPLFCLHSGGGHVFFYQPLSNHLAADRPLYAIQPKGLGGINEGSFNSIEEMAAYYLAEIRKVQPRGPYHLLGTCFSNAVGLEIAHQLRSTGEEIATLIFVDSGPAHLEKKQDKATINQPVRNFLRKLMAGDWKYLANKIKQKLIIAGWKIESVNNQEKRDMYNTILGLNELYAAYSWKPIDVEVDFIRSSQFAALPKKDSHLVQWGKLTKSGLNIQQVDGHHITLFQEPEVIGLAEAINDALSRN